MAWLPIGVRAILALHWSALPAVHLNYGLILSGILHDFLTLFLLIKLLVKVISEIMTLVHRCGAVLKFSHVSVHIKTSLESGRSQFALQHCWALLRSHIIVFKYLPCEWTSVFCGGKEDGFWGKSCINKLLLASRMLFCFSCLLKVPVERSLDAEISQNIGLVRRNWEPKQGCTFSLWSTIPPMFAFSAFFMMYWQRNVRISFQKAKAWMNKVFFSPLIPETGHGLFFFP